MMDPWAKLVDQSGILGTLVLLVIAAGKYALPAIRELGTSIQAFTDELVRVRESIDENTGWLKYLVSRANGQPADRAKQQEGAE